MSQLDYYGLKDVTKKTIEQKRIEMLETASIYGMRSEKTLMVSQELDELIMEFQQLNSYSNKTRALWLCRI